MIPHGWQILSHRVFKKAGEAQTWLIESLRLVVMLQFSRFLLRVVFTLLLAHHQVLGAFSLEKIRLCIMIIMLSLTSIGTGHSCMGVSR